MQSSSAASSAVFLGAVALEVAPGAEPRALCLAREHAAVAADGIANDLARLAPDSGGLDLVLAAALFDPAELLRPRWPVHAALARLAARAPGASGRVLAFGSHEGGMGEPVLEPDPQLAGGPMRLLPWLLGGDPDRVARTGALLEEVLLERGMAEAGTALALQEAFGVPLEHVRHASIHDLCALTAMQYRHAALEGSWQLVEAALLHGGDERFTAEDGPPLLLRGERVWMGTLDAAAFAAMPPASGVDDHRYWRMRERQIEAVLSAHGLAVHTVALATLAQAERTLRAAAS